MENGLAPTIETERLTLRPFRPGDFAAQAAIMSRSEVMRHLGAQPMRPEESWRRLLMGVGLWSMFGFGYWAVERREDQAFIGQVGFADFRRDVVPRIDGLPEAGWIFDPDAQGHGLATEAVRGALDWIDRTLAPPQVVAIIAPANSRSIRVAQRTGFDANEEARYNGEPILLFRRERPAKV